MFPFRLLSVKVMPYQLQRQRGQALIYGLFTLVATLVSLFFLFNTGQLASEKTKLVNTADAVAYSASVMHARALNFDAYNNRALVANEVLVAQLVSLSSWAEYAKTHVDNVPVVFPACADPRSVALVALDVGLDYAAKCLAIAIPGSPVALAVDTFASTVPTLAENAVVAVELSKSAIMRAEQLLHAPQYFQAMRMQVMQDVAARNYLNDSTVQVVPLIGNLAGTSPGTAEWENFTYRYTDAERERIATVAATAASRDGFVDDRRWDAKGVGLTFFPCLLKTNKVLRRGGTNLVGLDEWKAEDTESYWAWRRHKGFFGFLSCKKSEIPVAWGEQRAFPPGGEQDASAALLGTSPTTNPGAHALASSAAWTDYSGMPAFYDLTKDLNNTKAAPKLTFAVRLIRNAAAARTSSGTSNVPASPRLNNFPSAFAGGIMSAVATGEVYFERPWFNNGDHSYTTGDMAYIVTQNQSQASSAPKTQELGSLFNPYWQVHLVSNNDAVVTAAQTAQGATMPATGAGAAP